jgi:hypothetical protein
MLIVTAYKLTEKQFFPHTGEYGLPGDYAIVTRLDHVYPMTADKFETSFERLPGDTAHA